MADDLIATQATTGRQSEEYAAAEVQEIVDQLKADFADRDKFYADVDAVIFNQLPVKIPKAYKKTAIEVRSPLASHIVNTVTAALTVNRPTVQFESIGFGTSYEENSTLREHFFDGSFRRQEEEAKRRLFRLFMYSLVAKGEAVLKTVERTKTAWAQYDEFSKRLQSELDTNDRYRNLDGDAKSRIYDALTEEKKRQLPYPIKTTDVPPESFYYLKGEDGFTFCCEVKDIPYLEALERYEMGLNSGGKVAPSAMGLPRPQWKEVMGKRRNLQMIEAWDWRYVTYILKGPGQNRKSDKGTLVRRIRHDYGDPITKTLRGPYSHALGITTASRLPEQAGLGILYGFLPLFPLLNSLLTIESQIAYIYGWPTFKRKLPPGGAMPLPAFGKDGTEGESEETIEPGTIYPYDIEPVEPPRGSEAIDKMIQLTRGMLELALPSVVQGVVAGDQSGYALNQASYLARLAWDPIIDNAEFALAERVGFESWMIENCIREPVSVWHEESVKRQKASKAGWLTIGPDDTKGVHRYKVRLDPETPSNKIIEQRYHSQMMADRFETWEDAVEALGHNPDEVEKSWLLRDTKQDPAVKEMLRQRILQKVATIEDKRMQQVGGAAALGQNPAAGGGALGNVGQVFQPGQNGVPMTPMPQDSVMGMGPQGAAMAAGGVAGAPVTPGPPANHIPQPGE